MSSTDLRTDTSSNIIVHEANESKRRFSTDSNEEESNYIIPGSESASSSFSWDNKKVRVAVFGLITVALIVAAVFAGIKANSFNTSYVFCPTTVSGLHIKGVLIATSVGLSMCVVDILLYRKATNDKNDTNELLKYKVKQYPLFVVGMALSGFCGLGLLVTGIGLGAAACYAQIQERRANQKL